MIQATNPSQAARNAAEAGQGPKAPRFVAQLLVQDESFTFADPSAIGAVEGVTRAYAKAKGLTMLAATEKLAGLEESNGQQLGTLFCEGRAVDLWDYI